MDEMYQLQSDISLGTNINVDTALATILSQFETAMILDTMRQSYVYRFQPYNSQLPNLVEALESNFKLLIGNFQANIPEIVEVRNCTYKECIDFICENFKLYIPIDGIDDIYPIAVMSYGFFISKFTENMINFLSSFILRERTEIYNSLNLYDFRKNKDSSTIYAKKIFSDPKIAAIHANIEKVLDACCGYNITLQNYFQLLIPMEYIPIFNNINEIGNFFKESIVPFILDSGTRTDVITLLKLDIQRKAADLIDQNILLGGIV